MQIVDRANRILLTAVFTALAFTAGFLHAQTPETEGRTPLDIELTVASQSHGDVLKLHVKVKNIGSVALWFPSTVPLLNYAITDSLGVKAPEITQETSRKKSGPGPEFIGSVPSWHINAGQTIEFDEDIGKRYRLQPLLRYSVTPQIRSQVNNVPAARAATRPEAISVVVPKPLLEKK